MGERFPISWFGKSSTELKAIRERNAKTYSERELRELDELIAKKEKEEAEENE